MNETEIKIPNKIVYKVNCPLYHEPVDICNALVGMASQENHDGPEDHLMMEAAQYIHILQCTIRLFQSINQIACLNDSATEEFLDQIEDDPGILIPALEIIDSISTKNVTITKNEDKS